MSDSQAPPGHIWVCAACGKKSRDRYGQDPLDYGWDESCVINAVLIREQEPPSCAASGPSISPTPSSESRSKTKSSSKPLPSAAG